MESPIPELPKGGIEIHRGDLVYYLRLTTQMRVLLKDYADQTNTSMVDVGNRILPDFFSRHHSFEDPNKLVKETLRAIFPNNRAISPKLHGVPEAGDQF